jgi:hypothetical protein
MHIFVDASQDVYSAVAYMRNDTDTGVKLRFVQARSLHLWTDSRAVHDWLRVESRALIVFVKNRVLKIRQYLRLDQILWVPGLMNPADAAKTVEKLKITTNWLEGRSS